MATSTVNSAEYNKNIPGLSEDESKRVAELIQRTYRGHRARRQMQGFGLDAETRWYETIKDAQYHKLTTPSPPASPAGTTGQARSRWTHATKIAQRAGADDVSVSDSDSQSGGEDSSKQRYHADGGQMPAMARTKTTAKMMDLQYFLEMVDQKHRYGSNLRKYHAHWRTQTTKENFFYWLDQGAGKDVSLPECSRSRLESMQVRYLSRQERQNYLVKINEDGLLVWAKNGELVWTKDELYKDSLNGIVPTSDATPKFKYNTKSMDSSSEEEDTAGDEGEQYVNEDFHRAKGPAKLKHVSAAVLFNHMVRSSLRKGHKWIFVADTSFRLYIGYKQSGAFQHSSFMHGSRIAAAGLIKVKHGQLRSLSPLSGHYRPPAANFRSFVHSLRDEGVDMSRVSISKSYAVLVGMEGYTKGMARLKSAEDAVTHGIDKVVRPEKAREDEERNEDKSQSAKIERSHIAQQRSHQEQNRKQGTLPHRMSNSVSRMFRRFTGRQDDRFSKARGIAGTGPEDGVPPPEGKR